MLAIRWRWIFLLLIAVGAWHSWHSRSVKVPNGILIAPKDPIQTKNDGNKIFQHGDYKLQVLANFDIEARVLSTESYRLGRDAELVPVDVALGWGAMSDSAVLAELSISQSGRFYYYRWQNPPPIPPEDIARNSANMHLIPTNSVIEQKIKNLRVGQVVHIVGQLVEAKTADGWHWRSSLTRDDTGAGACELVRVESITIR
ncbi:MAG: hypothetical protein KA902_06885 [Arenimonas sp.]|nr:hypothetical protein [Arenimonas sp.]